MLNIIMPIAGRGSRFLQAGYSMPKPLVPVHQVPMIEVVVNNLKPTTPHRFCFLVLQEHLEKTNIHQVLMHCAPNATIIPVSQVTEGAACTVLLARDVFDNSDPMMIANGDQFVSIDMDDYLATQEEQGADGLIMTFWSDHPKWSYVRFDDQGKVAEVVEKKVVSNEATVGIYNFRRGSDFVRAAEQMIAKNLRVNNEFYVAPTYNQMIQEGAKIAIYNLEKRGGAMYGLGTPEDLNIFLEKEISFAAAGAR